LQKKSLQKIHVPVLHAPQRLESRKSDAILPPIKPIREHIWHARPDYSEKTP